MKLLSVGDTVLYRSLGQSRVGTVTELRKRYPALWEKDLCQVSPKLQSVKWTDFFTCRVDNGVTYIESHIDECPLCIEEAFIDSD